MSGIGSYSGKTINSKAAVAPTLDISDLFKQNYSGNVDYQNKAITENKETSLDLSIFIDEDIEKGENVLTSDTTQDRGSTEIDKTIVAGENVLKSEPEKKTEPIVIQEVQTEAPKEEKKWWEKGLEWLGNAGATIAVATTSVVSGVLDVGEAVLDGGAWVASKAVGIFSDDAEDAMKEFISRDLVSEANEAFYENTEIGRTINEASVLKYDSEVAQGIRDVSEKVTVFAAATAATVLTGGAATPLLVGGLGFAYGAGNAAENTYATKGTDTSTLDELLILANGGISALSWYTSGQLGKGFIEIGKSMAEAGVKEILAEMCRGIFSKDMLKELLKPGNIVGNAIGSLMQGGGDIALIATKLYNGQEVTAEEWSLLIGELIVYFGLNIAEDALMTEIIGFKTPSQTELAASSTDDIATMKSPEILETPSIAPSPASSAVDDITTFKSPEVLDSPTVSQVSAASSTDDIATMRSPEILETPSIAPSPASSAVDDITTFKSPEVLDSSTVSQISAASSTDDIATMVKYNVSTNNYETEIYELAEKLAEGKISIENLADLDPILRLEAMKKLDSDKLWSLFVDEFKKEQNILNKFTRAEFDELFSRMTPTELVDSIFADGRKMAIEDYNAFFKNFREHAAEHTMEVRNYAMKIAEQSGLPPSALAEVYYGAQYHDLGMRGGLYKNSSGAYESISSLDDTIVRGKDIGDYVTGEQGTEFTRLIKKYKEQLEALGLSADETKKLASTKALDEIMYSKYGIENWSQNPDPSRIPSSLLSEVYSNVRAGFARKNHPLNSALSILTEDVTPAGVDKNVVALLAMSHSKSTSGIKHFDNPDEWKKCIKELEKALKIQDPTAQLDVEALYKLIDDPVSFEILQKQALSIRDGDAMSMLALTAAGDTLMQTGNASHLEFTTKRTGFDDPVLSPEDELDSFKDTLINPEGNVIGEVTNSFSKTTHAGELNVKFDSSYDGISYQATITLKDPNHVPNCSMSSIEERIGEVVTYTNVPGANKQVTIELPKDAQGKALGKWYEAALDGLKTKEINKTISEYLEKTMGKSDWNSLKPKEREFKIGLIKEQLESGALIEGLDLTRIEFFSGDGLTGNIKIVYN